MPADSSTGIVADEEHVDELFGSDAREFRRILAQWLEPIGNGLGRGKAAIVEIVAPPESAGQALAGPALEFEGR